jgi:gluconokinase
MSVLVIDIGSSSTRALLCDEQARPIPGASAQRKHHFTTQPQGAAFADADHLRQLTEACVDDVLTHDAAQGIRVVGMATFAANLLGVDADNRPLTPLYTYADSRSAPQAADLRQRLDSNALHQRTGAFLHSAYYPAQLTWLHEQDAALFQRVQHWLDLATYCYRHWFGAAACSYSLASWSGLFNRHGEGWDDELLLVLPNYAEQLPALRDYDEMQRGLQDAYQSRWPLLADVPFCLAVGDGAAANVGSGAVKAGTMALTIGTTAALRVVSLNDKPLVPDGLWSYRIDREHHLLGGATSEGGNVYEWAQHTLQLTAADLDTHLLARRAGEHGLTVLPLFNGERSPGWQMDARGTLHGLTLATTPLDILQALLEGLAMRLAIIFEQLTAVDSVAVDQVMVGGGAITASAALRQIMADALQRPLVTIADDEITARGVAVLALHAIGDCALTDYPPQMGHIIEPDHDNMERMTEALMHHRELYALLYRHQR